MGSRSRLRYASAPAHESGGTLVAHQRELPSLNRVRGELTALLAGADATRERKVEKGMNSRLPKGLRKAIRKKKGEEGRLSKAKTKGGGNGVREITRPPKVETLDYRGACNPEWGFGIEWF